jgi:hypothetical protein
MAGVLVVILQPDARPGAGPLERWLAAARGRLAGAHAAGFAAAGATGVEIVGGPPDDTSFGARLRALVEARDPRGIVVLGAGSVPLIRAAERARLLATAADDEPRALANNRYSADVVAVSRAGVLRDLPDLPADNALPRWLEEIAGYPVAELGGWRLGIDVDGPLDLVLLHRAGRLPAATATVPPDVDSSRVGRALDRVAAVAADRRAELVVAGRTSATALRWLERATAARVRALVEERGLRAASPAAMATGDSSAAPIGRRRARRRPPRSVLGALLEAVGPAALGRELATLGDAALVDSRVLLAHRLGADERRWPAAEDRFASDLLLPELVADPWLRDLTRAAADAPIPVVLGGHTLVGPGVRLAVRPADSHRLAARPPAGRR